MLLARRLRPVKRPTVQASSAPRAVAPPRTATALASGLRQRMQHASVLGLEGASAAQVEAGRDRVASALDRRPRLWVDDHVSAQRGCVDGTAPTNLQQVSREPAMDIGEDQQEFEILPEDERPVVLPEHEPHQQPETAPA
jgi:hypothetical protein